MNRPFTTLGVHRWRPDFNKTTTGQSCFFRSRSAAVRKYRRASKPVYLNTCDHQRPFCKNLPWPIFVHTEDKLIYVNTARHDEYANAKAVICCLRYSLGSSFDLNDRFMPKPPGRYERYGQITFNSISRCNGPHRNGQKKMDSLASADEQHGA